MKKVLVFVLCFMLCFVLLFLCACGNTNEKNYEIKMFNDLLGTQPYIKQLTKLNELEITFNSDCRDDENMPASRTVEILGNAYTAPYWKSEWHYGVKTHYYYLKPTRENPDPELIMFMIDAKTDELTSYLIPYKVDAATEDEYLKIIRNEILPEYDLSAYQYTCTTVYNDGEIDDRIEQSFHVCDQNETLKYYDFDFRNMIGGYSTNDYLSVRFMKASETVSVHTGNRGYTENDFKKLLKI